jgi:hypothetical protein
MDQPAIYCQRKPSYTIARRGRNTVEIKGTYSERLRCTIVVPVPADGKKLLTILFFKGQQSIWKKYPRKKYKRVLPNKCLVQ